MTFPLQVIAGKWLANGGWETIDLRGKRRNGVATETYMDRRFQDSVVGEAQLAAWSKWVVTTPANHMNSPNL